MAKLRKTLEPGRKARVLIVDDSLVMRRIISSALEDDEHIEVVGSARNGREALEKLAVLSPDVVTLDIEMPEMDGLEALRRIRQFAPQVRVLMLSSLTERGAAATLEALAIGADDYLAKQSFGRSVDESTVKLREELMPKIKQFFSIAGDGKKVEKPRVQNNPIAYKHQSIPHEVSLKARRTWRPRVVAIGVSTGGPTALAHLIPALPHDFKLPILVVQHMPPLFTKLLCERLQGLTKLIVQEAREAEIIEAGHIYLAPGDYHMRVRLLTGQSRPQLFLDQGATENSCRPAVDVLFESIAQVYGGAVLAAVLTGMGQDGLRGAKMLKEAGGQIVAQDETSSAVWGMPRAIVEAKIASAVLSIEDVAPYIIKYCHSSGSGNVASLPEASLCTN